jgi:hypothetical protein
VLAMEGQSCGLVMNAAASPTPGHPFGDGPRFDAYERALPAEVGTSLVMKGKTEAGMQGKNRCAAASAI